MKKWFSILSIPLVLLACNPEPKPIDYGTDMCNYCKMTIVDTQHAAEVVTDKGRVHTFDAIECQVYFLADNPDLLTSHILVNDFERPGLLIDATSSYFLISDQIPSPMGANLSAFVNEEKATAMQKQKGGELYTWDLLLAHLQ